jgi:MFS family permease
VTAAVTTRTFDRRLIVPLVLGAILNPVNSSMLAVALVPIAVGFRAVPAQTAWLVSGLYLATATGQPVVGRLIDRYGARTLYLAGAGLVGIAGLIGTLAPTLGVLVLSRVLLGLGTCAGYPAAMYLIRRSGVAEPGGLLAALSVSAQTIVVIGPTVGGLLIGAAGWRALFAVNIPLAILCLVLGAILLPRREEPAEFDHQLDYLGIFFFAGSLTALMFFLMKPSIELLWLLPLTLAAAGGFVWRELRYADPFLDVRVFGGNAPLIATYVRALLAQTVAYAYLYGFTQWLEAGRRLSASHAGLILLPIPWNIGSPLASTQIRRPRWAPSRPGSAGSSGVGQGTRSAVTDAGTRSNCRALPNSTSAAATVLRPVPERSGHPPAPMPITVTRSVLSARMARRYRDRGDRDFPDPVERCSRPLRISTRRPPETGSSRRPQGVADAAGRLAGWVKDDGARTADVPDLTGTALCAGGGRRRLLLRIAAAFW